MKKFEKKIFAASSVRLSFGLSADVPPFTHLRQNDEFHGLLRVAVKFSTGLKNLPMSKNSLKIR